MSPKRLPALCRPQKSHWVKTWGISSIWKANFTCIWTSQGCGKCLLVAGIDGSRVCDCRVKDQCWQVPEGKILLSSFMKLHVGWRLCVRFRDLRGWTFRSRFSRCGENSPCRPGDPGKVSISVLQTVTGKLRDPWACCSLCSAAAATRSQLLDVKWCGAGPLGNPNVTAPGALPPGVCVHRLALRTCVGLEVTRDTPRSKISFLRNTHSLFFSRVIYNVYFLHQLVCCFTQILLCKM